MVGGYVVVGRSRIIEGFRLWVFLGVWQELVGNLEGVVEEFNEGISCKGVVGLKVKGWEFLVGRVVGFQDWELQFLVEGQKDGVIFNLSSVVYREAIWLGLGF